MGFEGPKMLRAASLLASSVVASGTVTFKATTDTIVEPGDLIEVKP
jgi:hypothetical protein